MISKEDETYRRQKALHDEELIRDRIYKAESKSFFSGCMLGECYRCSFTSHSNVSI